MLASGLGWFAVLAGLGAALALAGRFEGVRAARGEGGDERDELIDLRAMAVAGAVLVTGLTGGLLVALLQGDGSSPYSWILAAGGLAYVGAWAWLRRRSSARPGDSATANATAESRPCVSETCTRSTPSCSARAA